MKRLLPVLSLLLALALNASARQPAASGEVSAYVQEARQDSLHLGYVLRGNVSDSRSGRPLESVHVSLPDRSYATVTNTEGDFIIKSDKPIREIIFSHLGYRTVRVKPGADPVLMVQMTGEATLLNESFVISGEPKGIVRAAVSRIPENYSDHPELLGCFYRETLSKRQRYTYISEAVARIYKTSYLESPVRDRVALDKSRVLVSQRKGDTLSVKIQGGPTQAIGLDVVKNPRLLFGEEELDQYEFELDTPAYIDGRLHFVVNVSPGTVMSEDALYYGTLYIDTETLAFRRIELSLDMYDEMKATRVMLVKKPLTLRFTPKELSLVVTYGEKDGRNRLQYLRTTMRFNCDWRKKLLSTSYTSVNELVVTDLREPATPISRSEIFRTSDVLDDKAVEFADPAFWEDYNIIQPSESLEHAIDRLRKR